VISFQPRLPGRPRQADVFGRRCCCDTLRNQLADLVDAISVSAIATLATPRVTVFKAFRQLDDLAVPVSKCKDVRLLALHSLAASRISSCLRVGVLVIESHRWNLSGILDYDWLTLRSPPGRPTEGSATVLGDERQKTAVSTVAAHRRAHEPGRGTGLGRHGKRRSCRGCGNWAGPTATRSVPQRAKRSARPRLWLVHRGFRHARSEH